MKLVKQGLRAVQRLFWLSHKGLVKQNSRFHNKHAGETCIIAGNGASLRSHDLEKLDQIPIIGCSYTLIDKRMADLNVKYVFSTDPYLFYPILYNTYPFIRKFQKNLIRGMFEKSIKGNQRVEFFLNLTNFYAPICRQKNVNLIYHFGNKNGEELDMAGNFDGMDGALDIMIAGAKYMGFSKAILVGCDYLGNPPLLGHFYGDQEPYFDEHMPDYCDRVEAVSKGIDLLVVLPEGTKSDNFEHTTFEALYASEPKLNTNSDIVSEQHLSTLRTAAASWQAVMSAEQ